MMEYIKKITSSMKKLIPFSQKYRYIIGGVVIVLIFSFTIYRIDSLASPPMNQDRYNQGILELKKVEFDKEAIEHIDKLQKTDVNVRENLDENRTNPF